MGLKLQYLKIRTTVEECISSINYHNNLKKGEGLNKQRRLMRRLLCQGLTKSLRSSTRQSCLQMSRFFSNGVNTSFSFSSSLNTVTWEQVSIYKQMAMSHIEKCTWRNLIIHQLFSPFELFSNIQGNEIRSSTSTTYNVHIFHFYLFSTKIKKITILLVLLVLDNIMWPKTC